MGLSTPDRAVALTHRTHTYTTGSRVRVVSALLLPLNSEAGAKAGGVYNRMCFRERLVAFALVEGLFFSSSFCAIHWLKFTNRMPGLQFSNTVISRDEAGHFEFAVALYHELDAPLDAAVIHRIVASAVLADRKYVDEALLGDLIGMNSRLMNQYVEFIADRVCTWFNTPRIYNASNPFDWVTLGMLGKNNFFETRSSEYASAGVMAQLECPTENVFTLEADF